MYGEDWKQEEIRMAIDGPSGAYDDGPEQAGDSKPGETTRAQRTRRGMRSRRPTCVSGQPQMAPKPSLSHRKHPLTSTRAAVHPRQLRWPASSSASSSQGPQR